MPKKKPKSGKPKVHKNLEGFEINFNEFGELVSNKSVDELNDFLNKQVDDKKLKDRDDIFFEEEKESEEENDDTELNLSNEVEDEREEKDREDD